MEAALAPAPRVHPLQPALTPKVTPQYGLDLETFLRKAFGIFNRAFPQQILEVISKKGEDYNPRIKEILVENGWQVQPCGRLVLSSRSGMIFAHIFEDRLFSLFNDRGQTWRGGFILCAPYPSDEKACNELICAQNPSPGDDEGFISLYRENMPGICVCEIDATKMQVTRWWRHDVKRSSAEFRQWRDIINDLCPLIDISERCGFGEQLFETLMDDAWQWTHLSPEEVQTRLIRIADTAQSEDEVRQRVRDELGYPLDNVRVEAPSAIFATSSGFFVEITSPRGGTCRLIANRGNW